jgi:hypothetical protein
MVSPWKREFYNFKTDGQDILGGAKQVAVNYINIKKRIIVIMWYTKVKNVKTNKSGGIIPKDTK